MITTTDIDIDVFDRNKVLELFKYTTASINRNGKWVKHNTGVYIHEMPADPFTGLSTIDHKDAEEMGFFKLDILNVSMYDGVRDEEHLQQLVDQEPIWELLGNKEFTDMLFHVNGHDDVCRSMKPDSVEKLAAVLSVIRPAKRYLIDQPWDKVLSEVWVKPASDEYYFKKAHAISYALAVVVHMNLLCETLSNNN